MSKSDWQILANSIFSTKIFDILTFRPQGEKNRRQISKNVPSNFKSFATIRGHFNPLFPLRGQKP